MTATAMTPTIPPAPPAPAPAPAPPTPVMPNNLNASDLALFAKLRISVETLIANGVRRVSAAEAKNSYSITSYGSGGILFPARNPATGAESYRLRRDGNQQPKYICAKGALRTFFFPAGAGTLLEKTPSVPVVLVEAEKSSLALWEWSKRTNREIVPVALGGVWSWRGRHVGADGTIKIRGVLPDLQVAAGRGVFIMFDSNTADNRDVAAARDALIHALRKLRASEIRICELPQGQWNGPDDFLAANDDSAMTALFDSAQAAPPASAIATEFSEDALALSFTAKYADDFRFVQSRSTWFGWDGTRWAPDETGVVFSVIREICREAAKVKGDPHLASARCIAATERIARSDNAHAATMDQFDSDPWLLNTPSGTVDLRSGRMREHQREDYLTKMTAVAPAGGCPLWLKFLDRVTASDTDLQTFLQRMAGYFLTGDTGEQVFFFAHGAGANGKSVYERTLAGVLADYCAVAPAETFTASTMTQHPADLAHLAGARLAVSNETEQGRRWAEARVKSLCAGEPVTCRFMRENFFTYRPQFKLLVVGNHRPALRSVGEAIRRRMRLVPFSVTIPEAERDHALLDKLKAEWPGILAWAIAGCIDWQKDGLTPPAAAAEATNDYLAEESRVGTWISECCSPDSTSELTIAVLYENWRVWAESRGEHIGSIKAFSQNLETVPGLQRYRTTFTRGFRGIRLLRTTSGKLEPEC